MLKRSLPYISLGALGLCGLLTFQPAAFGLAKSAPQISDAGSVSVEAQLERTKLLAGERGETFTRIRLRGADAPAQEKRLPVALTLIIDTSGSMRGEKIVSARESAAAAIEQLQNGDRFTVITFSNGAEVLVPPTRIDDDNLAAALAKVRGLSATGGTDMVAGLSTGGAMAQKMASTGGTSQNNRVMLLSDGQPNTEAGLDAAIQTMSRAGILTTTLGIGADYNEDLMARLADKGLGNYYFVQFAHQMPKIFETEVAALATVVGKEAVVTIALQNGVQVEEVYGFPFSRGKDVVAINVGDVYAKRNIDILARLSVPAHSGEKDLVDVKVTYHDALDNQAKRVNERLAVVFTRDEAAVTASLVPDVANKTQKIKTALAMERATSAYAAGKKDAARKIIEEQKADNSAFGSMAGGSFAYDQGMLNGDLDAMADEAEAPAADYRVLEKKSKAKARTMRRH